MIGCTADATADVDEDSYGADIDCDDRDPAVFPGVTTPCICTDHVGLGTHICQDNGTYGACDCEPATPVQPGDGGPKDGGDDRLDAAMPPPAADAGMDGGVGTDGGPDEMRDGGRHDATILDGGHDGGGGCPCIYSTEFTNFCHHPPNTAGCPMTAPGGYCDPNGDTSYDDADWDRGSIEYRRLCIRH